MVQVLVYSDDGNWHPQGTTTYDPTTTGLWSADCWFGDKSSRAGSAYQVIAIEGQRPVTSPVRELPNSGLRSQTITVYRAQSAEANIEQVPTPRTHADLRPAEWPALNRDEATKLRSHLAGIPARPVYVACNGSDCARLAKSFIDLFHELRWPVALGGGGIFGTGVDGLMANPDDETARILKAAVEDSTTLRVELGPLRRNPDDQNPTMLVIGTKPIF